MEPRGSNILSLYLLIFIGPDLSILLAFCFLGGQCRFCSSDFLRTCLCCITRTASFQKLRPTEREPIFPTAALHGRNLVSFVYCIGAWSIIIVLISIQELDNIGLYNIKVCFPFLKVLGIYVIRWPVVR